MDQEWTKNGPGLDLDLDLSLTISDRCHTKYAAGLLPTFADSDIYWQNSGQETVAWFNHLCIHTIHTLYILFIYFIYLPDHSINVITTMLSLWIGSYLSEIYLNLRDKSLTTAGRLLLCNHV